ncbi:hypothetical protein D3C87_820930 [compost metagenome]
MRTRYIQDPVTLKLIPADQYESPRSAGPMIMGDIQPYQSMATGEMIMGRRQHREHLRQHRLIEVGNEKPVQRTAGPDPSIRQTVVAAVRRYS